MKSADALGRSGETGQPAYQARSAVAPSFQRSLGFITQQQLTAQALLLRFSEETGGLPALYHLCGTFGII